MYKCRPLYSPWVLASSNGHVVIYMYILPPIIFICYLFIKFYFDILNTCTGLNIHKVTFQQTISQYLSGPMIMR